MPRGQTVKGFGEGRGEQVWEDDAVSVRHRVRGACASAVGLQLRKKKSLWEQYWGVIAILIFGFVKTACTLNLRAQVLETGRVSFPLPG